jgi:hypothetical protein
MARIKTSVSTWLQWLEAIEKDIWALDADRAIWREMVRIVRANPQIPRPDTVMDWITRMFVVGAASGVRRQVDRGPDVVTLRKLLESIAAHPNLVTRSAFCSLWGDQDDKTERMLANMYFNDFASPGADHVDPVIVNRDISDLLAACERVQRFAHQQVAHLDLAHAIPDARDQLVVPTFKDLNDALDLLGHLRKRYRFLLTAVDSAITPGLPVDWTLPFTVAWLSNPSEHR